MESIKTVHVVFKTHLDIGYTDLAQNVIDNYMNHFIPKAIETAEQLEGEQGHAKFLWTTGSWLIHHYLKHAPLAQRNKMDEAIKKGQISWHGLPFTTHTELMDARLFEYGLSIAQRLDVEYNKKTIAAKMTDVPGHTIAMVPYLAKQGIKYLHLGVNPASTKPSVPDVFVWRGSDGSEVIVNYAKSYGEIVQFEGMQDALVFAHTNDNCGPSSIEEIKATFAKLSAQFPNACIKASTLDEFALKIWEIKDRLSIVYEEIGDSWIHGVATDPKKVSRYRELLRLRDRWVEEGRLIIGSGEYDGFCEQLLFIPEHTWGMDLKMYLPDYKNYAKSDFQAARKADLIQGDAIPEKFAYFKIFSSPEHNGKQDHTVVQKTYSHFESSWQEQRDYLLKAVCVLSEDKQVEVETAFKQLESKPKKMEDSKQIHPYSTYSLGNYEVGFGIDGSIISMMDQSGKIWSSEKHPLGQFRYETFGLDNYNTWIEQYTINLREHHQWADSDFGKAGFEYALPKPKHQIIQPQLKSLYLSAHVMGDQVQACLLMPADATESMGAPLEIVIEYFFYKHENKIDVTLFWGQKTASRLPEALWLSFCLEVDSPHIWTIEKMGQLISPLHVVKNGNRNLHATGSGVYYYGAEGIAKIESKDAPLISPGERRLLCFDNTFASLQGGIHFNLYNNIWGTNFPMWYEEDAKFRFILSLDSLG